MPPSSPEQSEASRIRSAFTRRVQRIPKDLYSVFGEGQLLRIQELQRELLNLLKEFGNTDLQDKKILEIGCGNGYWLREFIQWGAKPEDLFGIDLLQERIQKAGELCPRGVTLRWKDASDLEFEDCTFDLILQFTVFTSILAPEMKKRVATEMYRVLKPGGAILWYDYFVSNPNNPDVRGVTRREISELFPGLSIFLKRITLAPPLGRAIGPIAPSVYRLLSTFKPLCTHYLGLFRKP
jgi:ubiquinone/menaquinone biosynthesis C-methylase UbiE